MPLVPLAHVMIGDDIKGATGGRKWLPDELHVGFLGRAARFTPITGDTGADDIFPGMLTAAIARNDVVESKVPALLAAVLAGVAVAIEYLVAGHLSFAARPFNKPGKTYDRRQRNGLTDGVNVAESILEHLRLALKDKHHRPAGAAHRQRLEALVQDQHRVVNHRLPFRRNCPYFTAKLREVQDEAKPDCRILPG